MPITEETEAELRKQIDACGDCWMWTGNVLATGYGRIKGGYLAHRVAYEVFTGRSPAGLSVDHLCHNADLSCEGGWGCLHRRCVNPDHLEAVTQGENARRGRTGQKSGAMQRAKTHCKRGHPYDDENTYIAPSGSRVCVKCRRIAGAKHDAKRRAR